MSENIQSIKNKIIPILQSAGITRAGIFGSYARNEAKPESDVDILVEFPDHASLFDAADLQLKLEEKLQKKIELVTYRALSHLIRDAVLKEQISVI